MGAQVEATPEGRRRQRGFSVSLSFFGGIIASLLVLGVAAAYLGRLLSRWSAAFAVGASLFSLAAGLGAIFGPAWRRYVPYPEVVRRSGIAGAFFYGLSHTITSVTTSAGPLLLLLTVATAIGRPLYAAALSLSYGIGRGALFLLLGLFAGTLGAWLARMSRAQRIAEVTSGVALIALSAYFGWLASRV